MYKTEKETGYPNPLASKKEKEQPSYGLSYFKKCMLIGREIKVLY